MKYYLPVLVTAVGQVHGLLSPDSSPCAVNCGNALGSTANDEIQCEEDSFGSGKGAIFKACVNCQVGSTYYDDVLTDTGAALYNVRYATSYCLFGEPNGTAIETPCITSTACGHLLEAIDFEDLATNTSSFDYCSLWSSTDSSKCTQCLHAADQSYLANYITLLNAGCNQLPTNGTPISIEGSLFSTTTVNETTPSAASTYTAESFIHSGLPLPAKVAISFAGLLVILSLLGTIIICNGKRTRRAQLRSLEKKPWPQGVDQPRWMADNMAMRPPGSGVNDTPLSQRPLRSWGDSPLDTGVAAWAASSPVSTEGRYFSPYHSPVDGGNGGEFIGMAATSQEPVQVVSQREIEVGLASPTEPGIELENVGGSSSHKH